MDVVFYTFVVIKCVCHWTNCLTIENTNSFLLIHLQEIFRADLADSRKQDNVSEQLQNEKFGCTWLCSNDVRFDSLLQKY